MTTTPFSSLLEHIYEAPRFNKLRVLGARGLQVIPSRCRLLWTLITSEPRGMHIFLPNIDAKQLVNSSSRSLMLLWVLLSAFIVDLHYCNVFRKEAKASLSLSLSALSCCCRPAPCLQFLFSYWFSTFRNSYFLLMAPSFWFKYLLHLSKLCYFL